MTGVLDAYKTCIRQIQLYGPTNFSPVINHVARFAETFQDGSQYFILLIITDGEITDMPRTKQVCISRFVSARMNIKNLSDKLGKCTTFLVQFLFKAFPFQYIFSSFI